MSTPGVSLFQGGEGIQVNNKSIERAEEEEALEDERRRHEELGNLLQNAFDDLEEDETTMDSVNNLHSIEQNNNNVNNNKNIGVELFEKELYQLKMLVQSRTNEVQHFKELAEESTHINKELTKSLSITQIKLEHAVATEKNAHELLVESKEKCSNLENTITKLRNEKKGLENENNALLGKLETTQTLLGDVQRKYDMVEHDLSKQNARQDDLRRKQMEERHRAEIEMMQQQMDSLTDKVEKRQSELETLDARYYALQSSQKVIMIEKITRINELQNALSDAQLKCEELINKGNSLEENVHLTKLVATLQQQICNMETTISTLKERLESTTAELDVMDSLLHQHNLDNSPQSKQKSVTSGSQFEHKSDRIPNLKDELYRALFNVKIKRDEMRKLKQSLYEKAEEIKVLREEENKSLVVLTTLKEQNERWENKIKVLEEEFKEKDQRTKQSLHDLAEDKQNLKQELEKLQTDFDILVKKYEQVNKSNLKIEHQNILLQEAQNEQARLKQLYDDVSHAKDQLHYELANLQKTNINKVHEQKKQIENLLQNLHLAEVKVDELSKMSVKEKAAQEIEINDLREKLNKEKGNKQQLLTCNKCLQHMARIKELVVQLKYGLNTDKQDIEDLKQELAEANAQIKLSEEQEELIIELKTKAQQFEQYIKKSTALNTLEEQQDIKVLENKIRAEIALIFAVEMKNMQDCLLQTEQKLINVIQEYQQVKHQLPQRQAEVEILKQAILAERDKMGEMLQKKETLLHNCHVALKEKQTRINETLIELNERQQQIEAERKSMKAVMNQWEIQRKSNEAVESEWKSKLNNLLEQHEQSIEAWKKKYNSAKRTAVNYKRYAEDKETHMVKEYQRLKTEYDASVSKMEKHMKETLEQRNHEFHHKTNTLESKETEGNKEHAPWNCVEKTIASFI